MVLHNTGYVLWMYQALKEELQQEIWNLKILILFLCSAWPMRLSQEWKSETLMFSDNQWFLCSIELLGLTPARKSGLVWAVSGDSFFGGMLGLSYHSRKGFSMQMRKFKLLFMIFFVKRHSYQNCRKTFLPTNVFLFYFHFLGYTNVPIRYIAENLSEKW